MPWSQKIVSEIFTCVSEYGTYFSKKLQLIHFVLHTHTHTHTRTRTRTRAERDIYIYSVDP
jgi:hypothetical protein